MASKKISNYEKLLFTIIENSVYKIISAIELYITKYAYSQAYFLAVIAEEELAKLIILPIARELDELDDLVNNRDSDYYKHGIKQKLFTSFGLQNRTHEEIEKLKQECLYVGIDKNINPIFKKIKPDVAYNEIKHATRLLTSSLEKILKTENISKDLKKSVIFLLKLVKGCADDKLPRLTKDMVAESDELISEMENSPKKIEVRINRQTFSNPYELIEIFKAIFKDDYKEHLKKIKKMSFDEMVQYLGRNMDNK